jgi:hypothetical protein
LTPRLYFFAISLSASVDRIIAPVPFARTNAPETFGLEETRANVVSRSALFRDGGDIDIVTAKVSPPGSNQRALSIKGDRVYALTFIICS